MGSKHSWIYLLWILTLFHNSKAQLVRCDMPADVVFMLDASASIKPHEWEQEKDFVGILIDSLAVERHAINVGMTVFSTEIGQVVDLQPFKTRAQLKAKLPQLQQTGQGTDTARAIARMRQMMENQARDNAKKIGILITDGKSENSTATRQEAIYARQLDKITMVALGVGNETFIEELEEIAKSDYYPDQNRLFTVRNFAELQDVVEELRNLICEVMPATTQTTTPSPTTTLTTPLITGPDLPPISCPWPADVVFLLDGSLSITDLDWARSKVFVSTLLNSLEVAFDAINAGILVFSSGIGDRVPLRPFLGKEVLKTMVSGLNQPSLGRTNTALGIRALRGMFRDQGRPQVPHIGIVITDGKSRSYQETVEEARQAKTVDGIVMLAIGVGDDTLPAELEAMATSPDTLFKVIDFTALFDIAAELMERICKATVTTTTTLPTTTTTSGPVIPSLCQECLVEGGVGYNTYPPDCTKYVTCYPEGRGGYRAVIKNCPFGLFWSSKAVACVDAAFVNCSTDPCRRQPNGWGHTERTQSCGEYWRCQRGHSLPHCCTSGQRYTARVGCVRDDGCRDQCSLQSTLNGNGACRYRPNHADPFSYFEIVPGQGQVTHPCSPGTIYRHSQCACVFYTPSLGCVPSLHYTFDGTFNDKSSHGHSARVQRVLLTKHNSAYFTGNGHVQVNTLPANEFKDNFVLRLRYRVQPEQSAEAPWNDHYKWGFQDWFSSHTNKYKNLTFVNGQLPSTGPEPGLPSGQQTSTLEEVVILHNGTVIHGGKGVPGGWPNGQPSGRFVTKVHLGPMGDIQQTAVSGGVVYMPNNKGQILILNPATSPGGSVGWQIVNKAGTVMKSGSGEVPPATAKEFNFQLQPAPITRWFIMTATGQVLSSGTGVIPEKIKNLYKGFTAGKLLKVSQVGERVVEWSLSRPDGRDASGGKGPVPDTLKQQLKLDSVLKPEGGAMKRWAVLSASGDVMESGTGQVPADVLRKYSSLRSGLVLTDAGSNWQLQRTDGSKLQEGAGSVPSSVTSFIRGSLVLPSLERSSTWSVTLPNGTTVSGKGPIPDHIRRLFEQSARGGSSDSSVQQSRWYVTDGKGTVLESGYGNVPQAVMESQRGRVGAKVVQQLAPAVRGSNLTRWEVRGQDGTVMARGNGQPPADVFKVVPGQKQVNFRVSGVGGDTITSGANYPRYRVSTGTQNQPSQSTQTSGTHQTGASGGQRTIRLPGGSQRSGTGGAGTGSGAGGQTIKRWTVTLPNGIKRSGVGEVPADIKALLANRGGATGAGAGTGRMVIKQPRTERKWSVTMPNGTVRSGTGDMPGDLQALVDAQSRRSSGQSGGGQGSTVQRVWTVTMPNGTVRSGRGDIPADLQTLLRAQRTSGSSRTQTRWSFSLPDGSKRSGVGKIPADIQALMDSGQGVQSRWRVRMPDGTMRSGRGAIPADLNSLIESFASGKSAGHTLSRTRRAAGGRYKELLGNCGTSQSPSYVMATSHQHVRLTVKTTRRRNGITLTLPISPGMNDVQFVYNGKTLSGFSNGVQKSLPLTGSILPVQAPVTIGRCRTTTIGFRGEIDEVSLSACIS